MEKPNDYWIITPSGDRVHSSWLDDVKKEEE
jgi:hypothetical protein